MRVVFSHTLTLPCLQQSHFKVSSYVKFRAIIQTAGRLGKPKMRYDTVGGSKDTQCSPKVLGLIF